tara:strand:+ start:5648 stop:8035 length:2388 start_codon:yes stop_codon:yes gene_type:complete
MPAVKLTKFLGAAPKISPELLPDTAAQIASNLKLYSGDLLPYHIPTVVGNVQRNGEIKTIYPLRTPGNPLVNKWLSWTTDVDVAVTTSLNDEEQRIYFTGDGVPKVTNYAQAVTGAGPYPVAAYDLGLPLPTTVPTTSVASAPSVTVSTYARDAGNIATITTASAHNLRTGNTATVSGFTSDIGKTFNLTNVSVTVTDDFTFTYYSAGTTVAQTSDASGTAALAGTTAARSYVYTWVTPWGEESIPSEATPLIYLKEGQVVTVGNLPTAPPAGNNFISGIRLYRTVTGTSGTSYFRLRTIWFANTLTSLARTTNTVTAITNYHHNLIEGDKIKVSGVAFSGTPDATFDATGVVVSDVVDETTFTYTAAGTDKVATVPTAGTLYWDIAEPESDDVRYYESSTFVDDYSVSGLSLLIESLDADPPPADMQGLATAQNNILVGFVGNELCFSEPSKPWSWPVRYRLVFPHPIVAVSPLSGSILVMTNKFPYIVSGSNPSNMSTARIDAPYPCTSKRGVVNIGYGVVFPTYGGLGVYNPSAGIDVVTKLVHDWDTWDVSLDPTTIVAAFYAGKYFASHTAGSFIFERDDKIGGYFVDTPITFTAAYYDAPYNRFYYIGDDSGTLTEWDALGQPLQSMEWKSKVIVTKEFMNLGAARVVADYTVPSEDTEATLTYNATVPAYNAEIWSQVTQLGTINGPIPYTYVEPDSEATVNVFGTLNSFPLNGDPFTRSLRSVTGAYPVTFRLWANKQLVCEATIVDSDVFRLPTGYRTDTFEVAVSGSARVRAIHIGETPYGLRSA